MVIGWVISRSLSNLVGYAYPAYASFKALRTTDRQDDVQWLTYWIVMGFFSVSEFWLDMLISWFPFYYEMKLLFLLWLQLPGFIGATLLYREYVEPFLSEREERIDQILKHIVMHVFEQLKTLPARLPGLLAYFFQHLPEYATRVVSPPPRTATGGSRRTHTA